MKTISKVLLVLVVTLLLFEAGLRIVALFPLDSATFVNDEHVGFRMRPQLAVGDGNQTNSFGFNDTERNSDRKSGVKRLAIIGDSFVYGAVPRKDNFVQLLQQRFDREGDEIEVVNLGISGAGPENYLGMLKHDAVRLNSDAVYVVFFVGNDIVQSHPAFTTRVVLGSARAVLVNAAKIGLDVEYSYVYRLMRATTRLLVQRLAAGREEGSTFARAVYLSVERQRAAVFEKDMSRYLKDSYEGSLRYLSKMSRTAMAQGMRFAVVLVPDEIQVNPSLRADVVGPDHELLQRYDFNQPQTLLTQGLREKGIPFIDLLPPFQEAGRTATLYRKQDTHWNELGNRLAAEVIYREHPALREYFGTRAAIDR